MISRIHSAILQGIDAIGCEVEADVAHGGRGLEFIWGIPVSMT